MFTDQAFVKLIYTPGVNFVKAYKHFHADPRLVSPQSIISTKEMTMRFGEYEIYPEELAIVAINNGC